MKSGAEQLTKHLAHDPLLKSIEQMWNANPLHDVIPLDWGGHRLGGAYGVVAQLEPARRAASVGGAERNGLRSALDIWNEAGQRWWGQASLDSAEASKGGDRRFAAPEWQDKPVYRALKEVYLLASDWPLKHGEVADMGVGFPSTRLVKWLKSAMAPSRSPFLCLANPRFS